MSKINISIILFFFVLLFGYYLYIPKVSVTGNSHPDGPGRPESPVDSSESKL